MFLFGNDHKCYEYFDGSIYCGKSKSQSQMQIIAMINNRHFKSHVKSRDKYPY
jgi:hypothetical protein